MSGLYATKPKEPRPASVGQRLRALREKAGVPCREAAAAAKMDQAVLSKVENGRRPVTQAQLASLAKFYGTELAPLDACRIAEDVRRRHGSNPALLEAAAILREEPGEYAVNNLSAKVHSPAGAVNNSKKGK